jgi:hypothetical protein
MDNDTDGLADAAFSFGSGCHAHRFPMSVAAAWGDGNSVPTRSAPVPHKTLSVLLSERNRERPATARIEFTQIPIPQFACPCTQPSESSEH